MHIKPFISFCNIARDKSTASGDAHSRIKTSFAYHASGEVKYLLNSLRHFQQHVTANINGEVVTEKLLNLLPMSAR